MNRHERRRQKKTKKLSQPLNSDLVEGINLHINKNFKKGIFLFIKKALPLTLITGIIFIVALNFLNHEFKLNESVNMVIFIGLASLTFPHILLEYLIEKNEK